MTTTEKTRVDFLVVDPDEVSAQRMGDYLASAGFSVERVVDADEAHAVSQLEVPSGIVCSCDPFVPQVREFCRALKTRSPRTVIYGYVARSVDETVRIPFVEAGADDLLDVPSLMNAVQGLRVRTRAFSSADAEEDRGRRRDSALSMKVEKGELAHVLQFLAIGDRAGELVLHYASMQDEGRIFVSRGKVVHAVYADLQGMDALVEMITLPEADADFYEHRPSVEHTIRGSLDQVLLAAVVMADEKADAKSRRVSEAHRLAGA